MDYINMNEEESKKIVFLSLWNIEKGIIWKTFNPNGNKKKDMEKGIGGWLEKFWL